MRTRLHFSAASLVLLLGATRPAPALDCAVPAEVAACTSNADCRCGASTAGGACQVGAPACTIDSGGCGNFCGSFLGIVPVCRAGECRRARETACPGDCNADARVTVDELVSGVGIALERQPMEVCRWFDRNGTQHVEVAELIAAVRAALLGCLSERQAALAAQTYFDGQVTFEGLGPLETLGIFDERVAPPFLTLHLTPNSSINLSVTATGDDFRLAGGYLYTDIFEDVSGSAQRRSEVDAEVIDGTFDARRAFGGIPTDFVLRRSTTLFADRFAGRYEIRFFTSPSGAGGPSTAIATLDISPRGLALLSEAADVEDGGTPLGTITGGECQIAPGGHLFCLAGYVALASGNSNLLRLTGRLSLSTEAVASGEGQFVAGIDPPPAPDLYVVGSWEAVRRPEP